MRFIRSIVYRLGFRPKLGSIFFSPSHDLTLVGREYIRGLAAGIRAELKREER